MRAAALFPWFAPVGTLKFVGPAATKSLTRLLRPTRMVEEAEDRPPILRDLLFHLPSSLVDRRQVVPIAQLQKGQYATIDVTIAEHAAPPRNAPSRPYRVAAYDDSGDITLTFFKVKGDYLSRQLEVGKRYIICGTLEFYNGMPTMAHPDIMVEASKAASVLRLAPEYPLTLGISHRQLGRMVEQGLAQIRPLPEWLDAAFVAQRSWLGFTQSLQRLHAPEELTDIAPDSAARSRLAYDELLANQLAL